MGRWISVVLFFMLMGCEQLEVPGKAPAQDAAQRKATKRLPEIAAEAVRDERASARHLLIQYQGAVRAPSTLIRSKEQARQLAEKLLGQIQGEGADFDGLIRALSEEPNAPETGGKVGVFRKGEMVAPFETAAFALEIDEYSSVIETVFGFHIIQRIAIEEVRVSHILVQFAGAANAAGDMKRTKKDARILAEDLRKQALEPGTDSTHFADLARQYSNCPSAKAGGDLGLFGRGVMVPTFEEAAFELETYGISQVVETPFGFHIIMRSG